MAIGSSHVGMQGVWMLLVLILTLMMDCMYDYEQFMTDPTHQREYKVWC